MLVYQVTCRSQCLPPWPLELLAQIGQPSTTTRPSRRCTTPTCRSTCRVSARTPLHPRRPHQAPPHPSPTLTPSTSNPLPRPTPVSTPTSWCLTNSRRCYQLPVAFIINVSCRLSDLFTNVKYETQQIVLMKAE